MEEEKSQVGRLPLVRSKGVNVRQLLTRALQCRHGKAMHIVRVIKNSA